VILGLAYDAWLEPKTELDPRPGWLFVQADALYALADWSPAVESPLVEESAVEVNKPLLAEGALEFEQPREIPAGAPRESSGLVYRREVAGDLNVEAELDLTRSRNEAARSDENLSLMWSATVGDAPPAFAGYWPNRKPRPRFGVNCGDEWIMGDARTGARSFLVTLARRDNRLVLMASFAGEAPQVCDFYRAPSDPLVGVDMSIVLERPEGESAKKPYRAKGRAVYRASKLRIVCAAADACRTNRGVSFP
jgi:hypothetical protein